jgi:hypothetical protein
MPLSSALSVYKQKQLIYTRFVKYNDFSIISWMTCDDYILLKEKKSFLSGEDLNICSLQNSSI